MNLINVATTISVKQLQSQILTARIKILDISFYENEKYLSDNQERIVRLKLEFTPVMMCDNCNKSIGCGNAVIAKWLFNKDKKIANDKDKFILLHKSNDNFVVDEEVDINIYKKDFTILCVLSYGLPIFFLFKFSFIAYLVANAFFYTSNIQSNFYYDLSILAFSLIGLWIGFALGKYILLKYNIRYWLSKAT